MGNLARGWLAFILGLGLLLPGALRAAKVTEDQALASARALFDDHQYILAQARLSSFLAAYTNSSHRAFATLYLGRSLLEQSNYTGGIQYLTNEVAQSGELAAEYVFWIASGRLDNGQYAEAAEGFGNLTRNFTNSSRLLEAACDQADAFSRMEDWPKVIELLQSPDGAFRRLAAADPKSPFLARGALLLGEALMARGNYAEGEKIVNGVNPANLDAEWLWWRQFLLCRLELAGGRLADALHNSTNLLDTATGPRHEAASRFLHGEILEALGRPAEALQSYTNNLAESLPAEVQRQALMKIVQLTLAQNQMPDAIQLLESYVVVHTNASALDLGRLILGELYLKLYYTPPSPDKSTDLALTVTNYLQEALTNFNIVIRDSQSGPLIAQAHLDCGWCCWAQTNMPAARTNFLEAAEHLAPSPEQAVARFKLADTELYQHDYAGALSNYNLLLTQYANVEAVTNGLFDQALYQIVHADLARGDQAGTEAAEAAVKKILTWYPNSLFGDRGQLLIGESVRYDYGMAQRIFGELLQRSPHTPLLPEVEYAIARTYEQEGNWAEAARLYELWLSRHATNAPAFLPQVEYSRALVYGKAGRESNALTLFTNFVARFPSNNLAPWAQNWVADYYYNQGNNQLAEANYQLLYQKYPDAGDLPYQARLMAGRAALARQGVDEARQYFSDLVTNTSAPSNWVAEAWFALGDTILQQFQANPTGVSNLDQAVTALSNLTNGAPTNSLAAQAYGRLGDYYMQWADLQWATNHDPQAYDRAAQMYQAVTNFSTTVADVATRSEAEVALGRIAETQNQPDQALLHYSNVLYTDPEHADPFWVEQAGKAAADIYERREQRDKAILVYQRVLKAVPSLRVSLEKAILADQKEANRARN